MDSEVLSISSKGEMAIRQKTDNSIIPRGMLSVVPLTGGAPRELLGDVLQASWSQDGGSLAAVHIVGAECRLEYPIGKTILSTNTGDITDAAVSPDGKLIVSETGSLADPVSGISSYTILPDGTLSPITQSFPTLGAATCWVVLTPDAKRAYTANFGSSNISGFSVGPGGVLSPIAGTLLASNPPNSFSLDIAVSSDGKYVFNLNPGSGTIGVFVIESDGTLNPFGNITGLPISQGHSGIAAL